MKIKPAPSVFQGGTLLLGTKFVLAECLEGFLIEAPNAAHEKPLDDVIIIDGAVLVCILEAAGSENLLRLLNRPTEPVQ